MNTPQCMGGWCRERDRCAHYHAPAVRGVKPAERLCQRGSDQPQPVKWVRNG